MRLVELALQAERARDLRAHFLRLRASRAATSRARRESAARRPRACRNPTARRARARTRRCVCAAGVGGHGERDDQQSETQASAHHFVRAPAAARRARARASAAATAACRFARSPSAGAGSATASRCRAREAAVARAMPIARRARVLRAPCPAGGHHRDAVDRAGRDAQLAARAQRGSTVCMRFAAPTIASTGQASMHSVQPMHDASSIRATVSGAGSPHARSSAIGGRPVSDASVAMTTSPPGGQRLIGAPSAIASAYGRQPS